MEQIEFTSKQEAIQFVVDIVIRHLDFHIKTRTVKATRMTVKAILENKGYTMRQHERLLRQLKGN